MEAVSHHWVAPVYLAARGANWVASVYLPARGTRPRLPVPVSASGSVGGGLSAAPSGHCCQELATSRTDSYVLETRSPSARKPAKMGCFIPYASVVCQCASVVRTSGRSRDALPDGAILWPTGTSNTNNAGGLVVVLGGGAIRFDSFQPFLSASFVLLGPFLVEDSIY